MDELLKWRKEFPILQRTTYLISNSLGAMPRGVYESLHDYAESWDRQGVRAWEEGWMEMVAGIGDQIGAVLGARPGDVSLHENVTLTQAIISSCFDFGGLRNKIVMVNLEFPSMIYFYEEQRRRGARVHLVESDDGIRIDLDKLLAAIDEETLLVPVSYVLFRSAFIQDARAIIERAHEVGAHVVLDCFQAAATLPINLRDLGVDFAVGGVLKWFCGGPGVAYLYVRSDLQPKLHPALTGWMAHKRPFEFDVGPIDLSEGSFRFLNGTPHIPALYACRPGLELISKVGVADIRAKSMLQTQRLIEGALEQGWRVNTPQDPKHRGGTVSVDCPHAQAVSRELLARDILVDYRPHAGIRLSPHFYNRDEEIEFALEQIKQILASRSWERHLQPA